MKSQKLQIILIELKLCWVLVMNLKNKKGKKRVLMYDTNTYVINNNVKYDSKITPL